MTVGTRHPSRIRPQLVRSVKRVSGTSRKRSVAPHHVREREAGGPEDRALYQCSCGYVFEASVSTTVGCPHCGDAQAW